MSSERPYIKIPLKHGEHVRSYLQERGLLDGEYKIISEDELLYLPTIKPLTTSQLEIDTKRIPIKTGLRVFQKVAQGPSNLAEALEGQLSEQELALLPRAYDLIGDIAILEIPDELTQHTHLIGETFHTLHRSIRTVLAKRGAISGLTRIREYEFLSGENSTKTIHIEYGCRFAVDVSKAYFSPRLLEEHHRVAQLVTDDETVVDMFCGVGPFSIHIARNRQADIFAIDINPSAIDLLRESIELNKLVGTITPIVADAHDYVQTTSVKADRVIMNHPSGAQDFLVDACAILKPGGTIHYYDFIAGDSPETVLKEKLVSLIETEGRSIKRFEIVRRVRDSAPHEYQMVADIVIE